jgi:membrane-associated protease RseP (regulator of RpoE activity)
VLTLLDGVLIFLLLLAAYLGIVAYLVRTHRVGPDRAISLFGPALMLKTQRGRQWLDRLGRFRRFWTFWGRVGVALAAAAMVLIVGLLVVEGILATRISPAQAPTPQEAIGLPGINPIIPIGYGIVALVVGIVLHELAHGVMARSQGVGVKSLGILWFIVPVGAFVEQSDDEVQTASRKVRRRIAAAGILANFLLAILFFGAGALVVSTTVHPNANGVGVAEVLAGTPAANLSLAPGDILVAVNGTPTPTYTALVNVLANTTPGERVSLTYYSGSQGKLVSTAITLAPNPSAAGRGFLGVGLSPLTPSETLSALTSPLTYPSGPLIGFTTWIILPIAGLEPVASPTTSFFHLSGPLAALGGADFWILANLLYWLAWMNLLLGLSNALPLVPLDGGLLFRDFAGGLLARLKRGWDAAKLDRVTSQLAVLSSLTVLFLLAWQFVAPRL